MLENIKHFAVNIGLGMLAILLCLSLMDGLWLGWLAGDWYSSELGNSLRSEILLWPWLLFYLLYSGVIFVLAVVANRDQPWFYASIDGAFLGLASYGAYNLASYSLLANFSLAGAVLHWGWGVFLTACCATVGWWAFQQRRQPNGEA